MDMNVIVRLVLGAIGGNIGGALFKNLSLGAVGNSIAGIVGGGIGGQLVQTVLSAMNVDLGGGLLGMAGDVAGGGVGGIILMAIVGLIKNAISAQPHERPHA
jgi:uncharacterized membrane protein YeaQ/YmgE (transglycosylase-associated protein family)